MLSQEDGTPKNKDQPNFLIRFFTALLRLFSSLARVFTRRTSQSNQVTPSLKKALDLFESQFVSGRILKLIDCLELELENGLETFNQNNMYDGDLKGRLHEWHIITTHFLHQAVKCAENLVQKLQKLSAEKASNRLTLAFDASVLTKKAAKNKDGVRQPFGAITSYLKEETILEEFSLFQSQLEALKSHTLTFVKQRHDIQGDDKLAQENNIYLCVKNSLDRALEKMALNIESPRTQPYAATNEPNQTAQAEQEQKMLKEYQSELEKDLIPKEEMAKGESLGGEQAKKFLKKSKKTIQSLVTKYKARFESLKADLPPQNLKKTESCSRDTYEMLAIYMATESLSSPGLESYLSPTVIDDEKSPEETISGAATNLNQFMISLNVMISLTGHLRAVAQAPEESNIGIRVMHQMMREFPCNIQEDDAASWNFMYSVAIHFVIEKALLPITANATGLDPSKKPNAYDLKRYHENMRMTFAQGIINDWLTYLCPNDIDPTDSAAFRELDEKLKVAQGAQEGAGLLSTLEADPGFVLMAAAYQANKSMEPLQEGLTDKEKARSSMQLRSIITDLATSRDRVCYEEAHKHLTHTVEEKISSLVLNGERQQQSPPTLSAATHPEATTSTNNGPGTLVGVNPELSPQAEQQQSRGKS